MFMPGLMAGGGSSTYSVDYSLRFRASNSAYLSRTFGSPTNNNKWTVFIRTKRGALGANYYLGGAWQTAGLSTQFGFDSSDRFNFFVSDASAATKVQYITNRVFRDPQAWYNITLSFDNTLATTLVSIQVNLDPAETSFATSTNTAVQNGNYAWNKNTVVHYFGVAPNTAGTLFGYYDGLTAQITHVDGQILTASSWLELDATSGQPIPKRYTGTYGNNGSLNEFADASAATAAAIGKDSSGNGNNWTPSGISVTAGNTFDQMTDTPTNNYATLSNIDLQSNYTTFSNANLSYSQSGASGGAEFCAGTFGFPASGKWYFEITPSSVGAATWLGIKLGQLAGRSTTGGLGNNGSGEVGYGTTGNKGVNGSNTAYGASYTSADVIGVAVNCDANEITFYKNNSSQGAISYGSTLEGFKPCISSVSGGAGVINFGQRAFTYTPPTGFKALNTANLSTPAIPRGDDAFQAVTYTGTGSPFAINSLRFQPDFLAIKVRSGAANSWAVFDSLRGRAADLKFNESSAEGSQSAGVGLTSFDANGFTLGTQIAGTSDTNVNTRTYVGHAWKEGVTPGFDIVTYTGNATNRTISHSLGVVPHLMLVKNRTSATGWTVYHRNMDATPQNGNLTLNSTAAYGTDSTSWNNTAPTSSVFSVGTANAVNGNTNSLINYLWTSIPGFSLFGSYTGNGSADGPFVWCGFKPRWVMIKRTDSANTWWCYDTARNTFNVTNAILGLNDAAAESTNFGGVARDIDITANGFKLRTANDPNGSSGNFVFAAFAECPFKYATAR